MQASQEAVDSLYDERNVLAFAFAELARDRGWEVGVRFFVDDPLWPILYVETPAGQVSFHVPANEVPEGYPEHTKEWDGHNSTDKLDRLARARAMVDEVAA